MKKKLAKISLFIVSIFSIFLLIQVFNELKKRNENKSIILNYPSLKVKNLYGNTISLEEFLLDSPVVINYFNTECIFCKGEIESIFENKEIQNLSKVIFISNEDLNKVKNFINELEYTETENLIFLLDSEKKLLKYFGIRSVPMTYIYSSEGYLIESFIGMQSAKDIVIYLQ